VVLLIILSPYDLGAHILAHLGDHRLSALLDIKHVCSAADPKGGACGLRGDHRFKPDFFVFALGWVSWTFAMKIL
jgi:hypothetical protein